MAEKIPPIVGLKGIGNIVKASKKDKEIIIKYLNKKNIGIVTAEGETLGSSHVIDRLYWVSSAKPLKNTGWIPEKAVISPPSGDNEPVCLLPTIWEKDPPIPCRGESTNYSLPGKRIDEIPWKMISVETHLLYNMPDKFSRYVFPEKMRCVEKVWRHHRLFECGEETIAFNHLNSKAEVLIGPQDGILEVKKIVSNPKVQWIQPYHIVEDTLWQGEEIRSNFINILQPNNVISLAGYGPIIVSNQKNRIVVYSRKHYYYQYSSVVNYNLLANLRILVDSRPVRQRDLPKVSLGNPSLFLSKLKYHRKDGFWIIHMVISNPIGYDRMVRVRIAPPHYIKDAVLESDIEIPMRDTNSLAVPLPAYSFEKLTLTVKKRLLASPHLKSSRV